MWFGFGWLVACVWRTREEAREGSRKTNMEGGEFAENFESSLLSAGFSVL